MNANFAAKHSLCVIAFALLTGRCGAGPILDPLGDTFGTGPVQIDITSISASYNAGTLAVGITFVSPIAPASLGLPNSVGGLVDFDTDQNPNTGATSFKQLFGQGPPPPLGDE